MTIVVECAHCGRRSGAKDEWIGKSVKCPGCGQKVLVGASANAPAPPAAEIAPPPAQPPRAARPAAASPPAPQPARPAARAPQQPPAARPAGQPQAARRPPAARSPSGAHPPAAMPARPGPPREAIPVQPAMAAQPAMQPLGGDMLDLLGGDFGAAGGGLGPLPGGAMASPLGLPPAPRRKKGSNKGLFFALIFTAAAVMFLLCGGIAFVIVPPAIQAARRAASEAQARNAARSSGSPFSSGAASSPSAAWGPNQQYAAQLPTRVTFDRYSMQLPQGFAFEPTPQNPVRMGVRSQTWVWGGPAMMSGIRSVVEVDLAHIGNIQGVRKASPEELSVALPSLFNSLRTNAQILNLQHDPGERGQMSGRESIRARFTGTMAGTRVQGILYMVLDGTERLIMMYCITPEGNSNPPRDLLEASFLTLQ